MHNILVTGGAGYIGSHTCVELLNSEYNIVVIDNYKNSWEESLKSVQKITGRIFKYYECDIKDSEKLEAIFKKHKINAVIHFAGLKSVAQSNIFPLDYYLNNVWGTINLCRIMKKFFVKKIVFSSSATVYGDSPEIPFKEDTKKGKLSSVYGKTKLMVEEILRDIKKSDNEWSISILRYFNPVGAHESGLIGENPKGIPNNLMPFISQVAADILPELTIFSDDYETPDGTCIRDYIHVVDLAKGHILALNKILINNTFDVYNLGSGVGHSVLELVSAFEKACLTTVKYKIGPRRSGDLPMLYADTTKAKKELCFCASSDIEKMCKDTFNWQNKNKSKYYKK
ncbi:MAG: UDP-glucose 4-epimerase GalE [Oscillospiraceae bacterium]|nr:UDP-glucose 4-epimerase GalE [Oscillospiraceae bacterium]